jgi:hypothetical protein
MSRLIDLINFREKMLNYKKNDNIEKLLATINAEILSDYKKIKRIKTTQKKVLDIVNEIKESEAYEPETENNGAEL